MAAPVPSSGPLRPTTRADAAPTCCRASCTPADQIGTQDNPDRGLLAGDADWQGGDHGTDRAPTTGMEALHGSRIRRTRSDRELDERFENLQGDGESAGWHTRSPVTRVSVGVEGPADPGSYVALSEVLEQPRRRAWTRWRQGRAQRLHGAHRLPAASTSIVCTCCTSRKNWRPSSATVSVDSAWSTPTRATTAFTEKEPIGGLPSRHRRSRPRPALT